MVLSVQAGYVTLAPTEARPGLFPVSFIVFKCYGAAVRRASMRKRSNSVVTLLALADPAQRRLGRHFRFLR